MKKIKITKKQQTIIFIGIIFLMMLLLNIFTPLLADDYGYSFGLNGKVQNIVDVLEKQINHYFTWGGRSVAHTIAQTFLIFPKGIFSVFNAIVYTLLVYLIYLHSKFNHKEEKPLLLILIHLALWFFIPVFGQTCLWLIGSCNYLWTTTIILLFLYLYRKSDKDNWWKTVGMLLLGIVAGWTNENTGFGLIVVSSGILAIDKLEHKKKFKIKKYQISGIIGNIIGFVIMIIAPGNYLRNSLTVDSTPFIKKIWNRLIEITNSISIYLLVLLIIAIVLVTIYYYHKKKVNPLAYVFALSSILTAYAMTLSPTFPERAWFGVIVFMITAIAILLYNIEKFHKLYKFILIDVAIVGLIIYIPQYLVTTMDIKQLNNVWKYRESYIKKQKEKGKENIELPAYVSMNKHNPEYGLADLDLDANNWLNKDIAKYYELKSIKAKKEEELGD